MFLGNGRIVSIEIWNDEFTELPFWVLFIFR